MPSSKFCARDLRAAEKWLGDEKYLDSLDAVRARSVSRWLDDRPSALDELCGVGWEDPDEVIEAELADELAESAFDFDEQ